MADRKFGARKYRPGAVWRVVRELHPFDFVILDKAKNGKINYRWCQVSHFTSRDKDLDLKGDYSLTHLKQYAVCVKEGD
jgi:hypothetical protein